MYMYQNDSNYDNKRPRKFQNKGSYHYCETAVNLPTGAAYKHLSKNFDPTLNTPSSFWTFRFFSLCGRRPKPLVKTIRGILWLIWLHHRLNVWGQQRRQFKFESLIIWTGNLWGYRKCNFWTKHLLKTWTILGTLKTKIHPGILKIYNTIQYNTKVEVSEKTAGIWH